MSERTIAEIIGWEFVCTGRTVKRDQNGNPTDSRAAGYWQPPGVSSSDGSPPDVDDMTAWMSRNGFCVQTEYLITAGDNPPPAPVLVVLRRNFRDPIHMPMATSVREATEAAVREVDRQLELDWHREMAVNPGVSEAAAVALAAAKIKIAPTS